MTYGSAFAGCAALLALACLSQVSIAQKANVDTARLTAKEGERRALTLLEGIITPDAAAELAVIQSRARQFGLNAQLNIAAYPNYLGARARRAWYAAVAAKEAVSIHEKKGATARAAAELARLMHEAGNLTISKHMGHQLSLAQASAELSRARFAAVKTREELVRIMGVTDQADALRLPAAVPPMPERTLSLSQVLQRAFDRRIDVAAAIKNVHGTAKALQLRKRLGDIDLLRAGRAGSTADSEALVLPMYDFSGAPPQAEKIYEASLANARDIAIFARSELRELHAAYVVAHDLWLQHSTIVTPARRRIAEDALFRYNGMLASPFDVLAAAQAQLAADLEEIQLRRQFWQADANLREGMTTPISEVARMPYEH
jgi:outer membrane protein TolC